MALRKQIKELREKKKRYYLIFWPQEETYSIVQDSKVVEPKDPAVDDMVKVKEGGKVFVGKVAAVGSKPDVEARMSELEANGSEGSQAKTSEQKSPNEAKSAKSSKKAKPKQAKKRPRDKSEADTGKPPKKKKAEGNIIRIEGHDTSTQSSATTAQSLGGTAAQSSTTTSQSSGGTATTTSQSSEGTATTTSQSLGGTAAQSSTTTSQSSGGTAAQSSRILSQSSGGTATTTSQSSGVTVTTTSQSSGGTATTTSQSSRGSAAQSSTTTSHSSGGTAAKSSASTIRSPEVPLSTNEGTTTQSTVVIATHSSPELLTRSSEEEKGPGPEATRELRQPRIPFVLAASASSPTNNSVDEESDGTDYLALEAELQDVMERVTMLEAGQAHILEAQRSILRNQEEIFGRLATLENNSNMYAPSYHRPQPIRIPPPPKHAPPMFDSSLDVSFDSPGGPIAPRSGPPAYIPPPPAHAASCNLPSTPRRSPSLCLDENDYLGLDAYGDENFETDPVVPNNHLPPRHQNNFEDSTELGVRAPQRDMLPLPRNPFRPLQQNHTPNQIIGAGVSQCTTAPPNRKVATTKLPSSKINKGQLLQATTVIRKYPGLVYECKIGTLATKLAKEAFFGDDVLIQCTVSGERDYPGLPVEELMQLKHAVYMQFPQYWNSPQEFEPLWTKCKAAIGQACKRLRSNNKTLNNNK